MFLFLKKINTASYLFYFLFFFLFTKNIFSWNEVSCSQLKELSYESNEFLSDKCMQNNNQGVMGEYIQLFNSNGEMLFITDEYLNSNSVWNSDFSYQFLKRDYVENRILSWGFGNSISSIDNKVEEIKFKKHKFAVKRFKTDLGVGFMSTGQMLNHSWDFLYFNENLNLEITSDLLNKILLPMKIRGRF